MAIGPKQIGLTPEDRRVAALEKMIDAKLSTHNFGVTNGEVWIEISKTTNFLEDSIFTGLLHVYRAAGWHTAYMHAITSQGLFLVLVP